ncbi:MAG: glycosyltransferase family 2 protein [Nevskiaceae bacterium]|nr:MAG: glycosyltransferase family 2 protein [Nevskiaceae bacterium]TAM22713.1 MAG: glycosyltransferase family 2 protein [Nevskiaceae bacterium]
MLGNLEAKESVPAQTARAPLQTNCAAPSLSVIITAHNYRAYIGEAIDSVLTQQPPALELIVIDDGSNDGTSSYVGDRYLGTPGLQLITQPNKGQLAAFHVGVSRARGDIIAFLDADDLFEAGYLHRLTEIYQGYPEVDFVYADLSYFGQRQGPIRPPATSRAIGYSRLLGAYRHQWQGSPTSALSIRRHLALEVLRLPEDMHPQWRSRADDCLILGSDILGAYKYHLAEPLVRYRAHGSNAWLGESSSDYQNFLHWLRTQNLLAIYQERSGLTLQRRGEALRHAKCEFRTRPQPSLEELRHYSALVRQADLPWNKQLEHRIALWRHFLSSRYRRAATARRSAARIAGT